MSDNQSFKQSRKSKSIPIKSFPQRTSVSTPKASSKPFPFPQSSSRQFGFPQLNFGPSTGGVKAVGKTSQLMKEKIDLNRNSDSNKSNNSNDRTGNMEKEDLSDESSETHTGMSNSRASNNSSKKIADMEKEDVLDENNNSKSNVKIDNMQKESISSENRQSNDMFASTQENASDMSQEGNSHDDDDEDDNDGVLLGSNQKIFPDGTFSTKRFKSDSPMPNKNASVPAFGSVSYAVPDPKPLASAGPAPDGAAAQLLPSPALPFPPAVPPQSRLRFCELPWRGAPCCAPRLRKSLVYI